MTRQLRSLVPFVMLLGSVACSESPDASTDAAIDQATTSDAGGGDACTCGTKTCGTDGCGNSCGTCAAADFCDPTGTCKACSGGITPTTQTLTFKELPTTPELRGPGRGGEGWHGQGAVEIPVAGKPEAPFDVYFRSELTWARLEPTKDAYDFSRLKVQIEAAIDKRQKLSFGVMSVYPDDTVNPTPTDGGHGMSYPAYLHALMQNKNDAKNHGATDWNSPAAAWWLPNYNSDYYLERLNALYAALASWLDTQTYKSVAYKDVIGNIDVRAFGSWGEWHHYPFISAAGSPDGANGSWPVGLRPTIATLKGIVDAHTKNFANYQLAAMIASFDAEWLNNTWNPPAIAQYILDATTKVGKLGWRRDQWGSNDSYLHDYLENNDRSFNGGPAFKIAIMDRWKLAPILGEPECSGIDMALLPAQVTQYHATMVGNGNFCTSVSPALAQNFREASRRMGYRVVLAAGTAPSGANAGQTASVSLTWRNGGVAPPYDPWEVRFELQDSTTNAVVWSAPSTFAMRLFLPGADSKVTDALAIPANVPPGTYRLVVKVADTRGYRAPLPLAIEGRRADGGYTLVDAFVIGACK